MHAEPTLTQGRLLAKLAWELLQQHGPFESVADLTDALKTRCARLRIRWTNDDIADAFRLIESNTPLAHYVRPSRQVETADEPPVTHDEARTRLAEIRQGLGRAPSIKPMPGVRLLTDDEVRARAFRRDQQLALRQVQQAILEQTDRVAKLEDEIEP